MKLLHSSSASLVLWHCIIYLLKKHPKTITLLGVICDYMKENHMC